jgi:hypothetical protein
MKRHRPIGCNSFHFTKTVGKDKVCMYCGLVVKKFLRTTEIGDLYFEMIDFSKKHKTY